MAKEVEKKKYFWRATCYQCEMTVDLDIGQYVNEQGHVFMVRPDVYCRECNSACVMKRAGLQ